MDELAVDAHVAVANLLVDRGQVAEAINLARRGTLIVPLREDCHRTLMLALAAAGKRGEALRHFADFDGGLNAELQASPEPETMALAEMLRQEHQSSTRPAHVPATISPNIADMIGDGNGLAANSAVAAPLGETGVLVRPTDPESQQVPARPEHSASGLSRLI